MTDPQKVPLQLAISGGDIPIDTEGAQARSVGQHERENTGGGLVQLLNGAKLRDAAGGREGRKHDSPFWQFYRRRNLRSRVDRQKSWKERDDSRSLRAVEIRANAFNVRDQCLVDGASQQRQGKERMSRRRGRQRSRPFRYPNCRFPFDPDTSLNANSRVDKVRIFNTPDLAFPHI